MMNKAELRKYFLALRKQIPAELRRVYSQTIAQKVLRLAEETGARTVFAYLSFAGEVETPSLIQELLNRGIKVAVPRCHKDTHTMDAIQIESMGDLRSGAYGILEPQTGAILLPEEIDMILVPALAFDKKGYRLGWGAGYYDRYLNGYQGITAGLCFSVCQMEELPRDSHDLPVTLVLNEQREG